MLDMVWNAVNTRRKARPNKKMLMFFLVLTDLSGERSVDSMTRMTSGDR